MIEATHSLWGEQLACPFRRLELGPGAEVITTRGVTFGTPGITTIGGGMKHV